MRTKLTIRSKLAAALALPLVALTVFVGFQLRDEGLAVYLLAALGSVSLSVFVLLLANVWITTPLRRLADEALEAADDRLPAIVEAVLAAPVDDDAIALEPVRGRGGAEIVDVANALNVLQQRAVELATEQAALRRSVADALKNLGRRTQQLLSRQIELISRLEQKEQNPELLDQLFKLDHLATRMRRNAESLLVLAGEEAPRQWRAAQPVGDLVRASLGEVEDYARVRIHQLDPATIVGHAVADLSHVLAELLENGLSFSPPDSVVDLYGRLTPHGYVVSVNDHGIGMSPDDLARANERIVTTNALALAPARYLGHYVVASLTKRHGVAVSLTESPGGGVTATIVLPPALVEDFEASEPEPAQVFDFDAAPIVDTSPVAAPEPGRQPSPEPEPEPEPEPLRAPAFLESATTLYPQVAAPPRLAAVPEPAPVPDPGLGAAAGPEPGPATTSFERAEPYAELVALRREREAAEIAGAVEAVKDTSGAPGFFESNVDDLLPRLPRRRDHRVHAQAPIVMSPRPAPEVETAGEPNPAQTAANVPVSEEVQSNMAVYAAFRAAAERGREDARH